MNHTFQFLEDLFNVIRQSNNIVNDLSDHQNIDLDIKRTKAILKHPLIAPFFPDDTQSMNFVTSLIGVQNLSRELTSKLSSIGSFLGSLSSCIRLDRFSFFTSLPQLESEIGHFIETEDFFAAIVFDSMLSNNSSNEIDALPDSITYSVRMLSDRSPRPTLPPGNDEILSSTFRQVSSESEVLQYLYGFILIQDSVDNAIARVRENGSAKEYLKSKIYIRQMPDYDAIDYDQFSRHMSLWLPLFVAFAWTFFVALSIRSLMYEAENGLDLILRSIGISQVANWSSWFVTSFTVTTISCGFLTILFKISGIIQYSNLWLIFFLMINFEISILMFSYLIGSIFRATSLATVTSVLTYLLGYLPYIICTSVKQSTLMKIPPWIKMLSCISSPTAFSLAFLNVAQLEEQGLGQNFLNLAIIVDSNHQINFEFAFLAITTDSFLYYLIAVFLRHSKAEFRHLVKHRPRRKPDDAYEGSTKPSVVVRNLTKSFENSSNLILNELNLDLYDNHITILLGPNGTGKTTLIGLLTGTLDASSGTVQVYDQIILDKAPSSGGDPRIGYCPQFSKLYDLLTVREHLEFYGRLRSILNREDLSADIDAILRDTSLVEFADQKACHLSGGTKRRLCLATAFVGGSKFVILDEPTAGVDALARRQMWRIIKKLKNSRTILLCTHFMDETEFLGDVVLVLEKV